MERELLPQVVRIEPLAKHGLWECEPGAGEIKNSNLLVFDPKFPKGYGDLIPMLPNACYEQTFLLSPFDDKYIPVESFDDEVAQDKILHICEILQELGAVHIKYETKSRIVKREDISVAVKASVKKWQSELDVDVQTSETFEKNDAFSRTVNYTGGVNWKEAEALARKHHLQNDKLVSFFLESCKPEKVNKQIDYKETASLSEEINSTLNVAVKLSCVNIFNLNTTFAKKTFYKRDMNTTFTVRFQ